MKKNCDRAISLLQQALRELGQDFALSPARTNVHAAIKVCMDVNKKRGRREELNKKLAEDHKARQDAINKKVAEYWKQKQLEKDINEGLPDNSQDEF